MTREEAIKIIQNEYKCVDRECDIEKSCGKCPYMMPTKEPILKAYEMAIQALEQVECFTNGRGEVIVCDEFKDMLCDDAISREAVLKKQYRIDDSATLSTRDVVNVEDIEDAPSVTQKPIECDDAISRDAVYSILKEYHIDEEEIDSAMDECQNLTVNGITSDVSLLPSVTQKLGKWIGIDEEPHEDYECDKCGYVVSTFTANIEPHTEYKYCPNCGCRMVEPRERSDKEC